MLYLSQVLGRPIRDLEGERVATVKDVIVRLGEQDHPPVTGLVARFGHAGLAELEQHFLDDATQSLAGRVTMELDAEVDAAYPQRWIGKVTVHTTDGRVLQGRVDEPKGDPGNTLSRAEITAKALRLAAFSGGATPLEMQAAVDALWQVAQWPRVGTLLPATP